MYSVTLHCTRVPHIRWVKAYHPLKNIYTYVLMRNEEWNFFGSFYSKKCICPLLNAFVRRLLGCRGKFTFFA